MITLLSTPKLECMISTVQKVQENGEYPPLHIRPCCELGTSTQDRTIPPKSTAAAQSGKASAAYLDTSLEQSIYQGCSRSVKESG
mmetsp:Transcript_44160/g.70625  ORF Transcript_44160/g.70625 Transcript_44160/m.70625 type:complete len:85 (+) Transcript_44160:113-367(+)